jgi:hypothetical protein
MSLKYEHPDSMADGGWGLEHLEALNYPLLTELTQENQELMRELLAEIKALRKEIKEREVKFGGG